LLLIPEIAQLITNHDRTGCFQDRGSGIITSIVDDVKPIEQRSVYFEKSNQIARLDLVLDLKKAKIFIPSAATTRVSLLTVTSPDTIVFILTNTSTIEGLGEK